MLTAHVRLVVRAYNIEAFARLGLDPLAVHQILFSVSASDTGRLIRFAYLVPQDILVVQLVERSVATTSNLHASSADLEGQCRGHCE